MTNKTAPAPSADAPAASSSGTGGAFAGVALAGMLTWDGFVSRPSRRLRSRPSPAEIRCPRQPIARRGEVDHLPLHVRRAQRVDVRPQAKLRGLDGKTIDVHVKGRAAPATRAAWSAPSGSSSSTARAHWVTTVPERRDVRGRHRVRRACTPSPLHGSAMLAMNSRKISPARPPSVRG